MDPTSPEGGTSLKEPDAFDLLLHRSSENRALIQQVERYLEKKKHLKDVLYELKHGPGAQKRLRRTANEIERLYRCEYCHRSYGYAHTQH